MIESMTLTFIAPNTFWHFGVTVTSYFQRENYTNELNMPKLFLTFVTLCSFTVTYNISITGAVFSVFDK